MISTVGSKGCTDCTNSGYDSPDYYCENGPNCYNIKRHKSKEMIKKSEEDFGFSFVDEDEIAAVGIKSKTGELLDAIMPFLDNLAKNPEKDHIKWPNRVEKIEKFKKKLLDIAKS